MVISLPYIFQVLYVLCFTRPRYQVSVYRTTVPLVYCCATADILTKLLQQSVLWLYLGNSQVSVDRTIGPTLVLFALRLNVPVNTSFSYVVTEPTLPE